MTEHPDTPVAAHAPAQPAEGVPPAGRRPATPDPAAASSPPTNSFRPEPELIARLQVSRDTLREALRILESQQLLEIKRGRGGGAVVRRPGLQAVARYVALLLQLRRTTLAHLEEARSVIEPSAAQQVAMLAGTDHLDGARKALRHRARER